MLAISGCLSFSSFQSARIVPPDKVSTNVSLARNDFLEDALEDPGWIMPEVHGRSGLREGMDGAIEVMIARNDGGAEAAILGADARVALDENHLAFVLPVQYVAGDWQFLSLLCYPGLVATIPLSDRLEINASANGFFFARFPQGLSSGWTAGRGWRPSGVTWTLHPELAWLRYGGDGEVYRQFGPGIEFAPR